MTKKRRTYLPRIVGDKVMMPADLKRLHKYMLDVEHIGIISDEMRVVVEANGRSWRTSCYRQTRRGDHAAKPSKRPDPPVGPPTDGPRLATAHAQAVGES